MYDYSSLLFLWGPVWVLMSWKIHLISTFGLEIWAFENFLACPSSIFFSFWFNCLSLAWAGKFRRDKAYGGKSFSYNFWAGSHIWSIFGLYWWLSEIVCSIMLIPDLKAQVMLSSHGYPLVSLERTESSKWGFPSRKLNAGIWGTYNYT